MLSKEPLIVILKQYEAGLSIAEFCRKRGFSDAAVNQIRGMDVSEECGVCARLSLQTPNLSGW